MWPLSDWVHGWGPGIAQGVIGSAIFAMLLALIARVPLFKDWLASRPWAVAGVVGAIVALTISAVITLALDSIIGLTATASLPLGAIIAFDDPKGCPVGWIVEERLIGNTIIGAGTVVNLPPSAAEKGAGYGASEGSEGNGGGYPKYNGKYIPFPNMEPVNGYIINDVRPSMALWYCKKQK